jgi:autotransporter-associated beta strand protein
MNRAHVFFVRAANKAAHYFKPTGHCSGQSLGRLLSLALVRLLLVSASVVLFDGRATGASVQWTLPPGQSGDWSVASNWGTGSVPGSGDFAIITNGGSLTITSTANCYQLSVGTGSVQMTSGSLAVTNQLVNSGIMVQSGGMNSISNSINVSGSSNYYLTGTGVLNANLQYISGTGSGGFMQSGGTNIVGSSLDLGYQSAGNYSLSGSGQLSAPSEIVGYTGANSLFQQSGGSNAVRNLSIASGNRYLLSGGSLNVSTNLTNKGTFDGGGGAGSLIATNAIIDLSQGALQNTGSMYVSIDAKSLLLLPAGFNLATGFGTLNSLGIAHVVGTTLVVPAGTGFSGQVTINDPVSCQGTILATSGTGIKLGNGLTLSGTGIANLGSGTLTVNDPISAMSGGTLVATAQFIGTQGLGIFNQSGGASKLTNLYVDVGTYNLSGNATLSTSNAYVANGGPANFNQTGGTHAVAKTLYVGNAGSGTYAISGGMLSAGTVDIGSLTSPGTMQQSGSGTVSAGFVSVQGGNYNLTDSGKLSAGSVAVAGNFSQSGGKVAIGNGLTLGIVSGDVRLYGAYDLSGNAQLLASNIYVGNGLAAGVFTQSGGTNTVAGSLNIGSTIFQQGGTNNDSSYSLGDGSLLLTKSSNISGTFLQSGGTHAIASNLLVTGSSTYYLSGNSLLSESNSYLDGSFTQTGGTHRAAANFYLGYFSQIQGVGVSNSGSYNLSGNALLSTSNSFLGGTFLQSGGTHAVASSLYVGESGSVPNSYYALNGSAVLSASNIYLGYLGSQLDTMTIGDSSRLSAVNLNVGQNGAGTVTQSGGTVAIANAISVGSFGQSAAYNLCGGSLSAGTLSVGSGLAKSFIQSSGSAILGTLNIFSSGANTLSGGQLSAGNMTVSGIRADFTQLGGANTISNSLNVSFGTYGIGGGLLSAANMNIGLSSSLAAFSQTGGSTSAGLILVGTGGRVVVGGGSLTVNSGLTNQGVFDGAGGSASIAATNSIVDFSAGTLQNVGAMSVSIGLNSLMIVPAGFNPYAAFGSFSSQGILHFAGTPLVLTANQGFAGQGSVNDPVIGEGTIAASPGGAISLNNGLYLSGAANVNLGSGSLTVLDASSGMKGGLLQVGNLYVTGNSSPLTLGVFTQSGGTDVIAGSLILGGGSSDAYNLGGGLLVLSGLAASSSGSATFDFNGGTLRAGRSLSSNVPLILGAKGGNATIDTNGYVVTLSGSITGPGKLIKTGSGTLVLSGTNTYTGGTTISAGKLIVTSPMSPVSGTDLTIGSASAFLAPIVAGDVSQGSSSSSSVPEPDSDALLVVGATVLAAYGLRRKLFTRPPALIPVDAGPPTLSKRRTG